MKFGLFVKCPHPEIIEAMGIVGMNFAVIDMEHTPLGPRDLYPLILAAELRNIELIIRIPENSERYIKWCLDLSATTIQIPNVESVEDVLKAQHAAYFYPVGQRGLCRFVRGADFSNIPGNVFTTTNTTKLIFQLEGAAAVENSQNIIDVLRGSIGMSLFVGPYDLSQSMGIPGQMANSELRRTMHSILARCKDAKVPVGTFASNSEERRYWANAVDFIEYASDLSVFMDALRVLKVTSC